MKKYIAYLIQKGDGCDYTIGCGNELIEITNVANKHEAEKKLEAIILQHYRGDFRLFKATLYEVENFYEIEVDEVYFKDEERKRFWQENNERKKELEEYERLKLKYEN